MNALEHEVVVEAGCRVVAAERILADVLTVQRFDMDLTVFGVAGLLARAPRLRVRLRAYAGSPHCATSPGAPVSPSA